MTRVFRVLTVLSLTVASAAAAQSLGDVAKKEEARRRVASKPGKVYTNDTIRGGSSAAPPPAPAQTQPSAADAQQKTGEKPAPDASDPKKDEAHWRGRMAEARRNLDRAKMFQESLQTRINSLSNDFSARDDPAQRNVIAGNRQKALAELERVAKEVADYEKQIVTIEEEARKAGVPPGWVR
jgi:hypothetical protein